MTIVCSTLSDARKALGDFDREHPVFLDTETTGLNPRRNKLVAVQLYQELTDQPVILDMRHLVGGERVLVENELSFLLCRVPVVVGHNIKFDVNFLAENRVTVGRLWDTKVAEQVLVGQGAQEGASYHLTDLVLKYTGQQLSKAERTWFYLPKPLDERTETRLVPMLDAAGVPVRDSNGEVLTVNEVFRPWDEPFPEEEVQYMALDVTVLPAVYYQQLERFEERPKLHRVFKLEMRCLPAYAELEQTGMRIDMNGWRAFIEEKQREAAALEGEVLAEVAVPILEARLAEYDAQRAKLDAWQAEHDAQLVLAKQMWERRRDEPNPDVAGWGEWKNGWMSEWREHHPRPETPKQDTSLPNVNSQEQMVGAFRSLGLPVPEKLGRPSLDAKLLQPLEDEFPLLRLFSRERKAVKFVDAFGESLLVLAEPEEEGFGRLHPTINSIGAATGRNSMSEPNLQQVPSKGDGQRLRALVVAAPGHKLVICDFSNIEWRIMAAVSKDKTAIGWLAEGLDIHCEVARRVWGLGDMTKEQMEDKAHGPIAGWGYRDLAKVVNYGLLYGMTEMRLARTIKSDVKAAKAILDGYFASLPGFRRWLDSYGDYVLEHLHSETLLGRVRSYHQPRTRGEEGRVRRQGCNAVIQGTSADMTKGAVALYFEAPERMGTLIAVVHDELVVEVPTEYAEDEKWLLEDRMDVAQVSLLCPRLPRKALPRPEAKVSDYWKH